MLCIAGDVVNLLAQRDNEESDVMCVIEENEEVMIDPYYSTEDWYKVYTKEGVDGFSMKEFIKVQ